MTGRCQRGQSAGTGDVAALVATDYILQGNAPMTSTREKRIRQGLMWAACFGGGMGLFNLYVGLSRPSIANMRIVDIMHLLATGAFFGVCLLAGGLYFGILRQPKAADAEPGTAPDPARDIGSGSS
jgi:hypothetical protein